MKNLLFILTFFISFALFAQDDANTMFQAITLAPKDGQGAQLRAGIKAHNAKFHQEGNEAVNVWMINSGPRFGTLIWVKGPLTYTDMDSPLQAEGHMDDWQANVTPHATMESMDFWGLVDNLAYMPEGHTPKVIYVRYFDIKRQKGNNSRHIWKSIVDMYKENTWDMGLQVYSNWAPSGDHRDWAIMWSHDNWASMDKNRKFFSQYEEKYGIDRAEFFEGWNEASKFMNAEIWTLVPELSVLGADQD